MSDTVAKGRVAGVAVLVLVLVVVLSGGEQSRLSAQTAIDESVMVRPRPDYDPDGLYGADLLDALIDGKRSDASSSILLFPRLSLGAYGDDNLLRKPSDQHGDLAATIDAALGVVSLEPERGFTLDGSVHRENYRRFVAQDFTAFSGAGRLYWSPIEDVTLSVDGAQQHQRQSLEESASSAVQTRATFIDQSRLNGAVDYLNDDWALSLNGGATVYRYERNPPVIFGAEYNRTEWLASARIGRTLTEGSGLFIEPQVNLRRYETAIGLDGYHHNSAGEQILAGMRFDFSSVTYAELGVGWLVQNYADAAFPSVSGPSFSARLVWNPLDRITLSLDSGRRIAEANLPKVAGVEVTFLSGSIDYEVAENWLASIGAAGAELHYQAVNGGFVRQDQTLQGNIGLRYLFNQRISFTANSQSYQRQSNQLGQGLRFNRNEVTMTLQY